MVLRLVVRHPNSTAGEDGEVHFEFDQARVMIGRSPGADVQLPDATVSDNHALIERTGDHYTVRDEGSTNGTLVNGKALVPRRARALEDGDQLQLAAFTLDFSAGTLHHGPTSPERTASLARRMLRELLGGDDVASAPPFLEILEGEHAGQKVRLGDALRLSIGSERGVAELVHDLDGSLVRAVGGASFELNGKPARERRLRDGDLVRAGAQLLAYRDPTERALRELEQLPDERTRTRTELASASAPEPVPSEPEDEPTPEPLPDPALEAPDSHPPATSADLLVYGLAGLVLIASLFGLFWLFR